MTSEFERTPPHDIAAEQCVLGGMLLSREAIADVAAIIGPEDHYRAQHQVIHEAITGLDARREPVDAVTIAAELAKRGELVRAGGGPYLHTLIASVPTAANASYYAGIVREKAILRHVIERGTRAVQMAYAGEGGAAEIAEQVRVLMDGIDGGRGSGTLPTQAELVDRVLASLEADPEPGLPTGFEDLTGAITGMFGGELIIIAARPGVGKALALDTPMPTPTGWTTMGDVQVGDHLIGMDGKPAQVTATTDVMYDRECYDVEFSDGTVITADAQHLWLTETRASRRAATPPNGYVFNRSSPFSRDQRQKTETPSVKTTEDIRATLRTGSDRRVNHSVPLAAALDLPEADLPVPPYTLGCWLGDGNSNGGRITTMDPEIISGIESEGLRVVKVPSGRLLYSIRLPERPLRRCPVCGKPVKTRIYQVRTCGPVCGRKLREPGDSPVLPCPDCGKPSSGLTLCQACRNHHGSTGALLRSMGVLHNKHIPAEYLRASETQRRALLAGLLDTDGYCNKSGTVQFAVTSRRLAGDAMELVLSLGYRATMTSKPVAGATPASSICYIVTFTPPDKVFRLTRKLARQVTRVNPGTRRRFIVDVRPVPSVPVRCVQLDNADHLYLASKSFIPTHNSTLGYGFANHVGVKLGLPVLFMSLEMSQEQLTERFISAQAQVSLTRIRRHELDEGDWDRVQRAHSRMASSKVRIDDTPHASLADIRARLREMARTEPARLLVVDYLGLLAEPKGTEGRRESAVAALSRGLKLIAREFDIPVVALAQLNRNAEQRHDKRPQLSDLRESGAQEQDADIVLLLHREDAYDRESPRAGEIDVIVAKQRQGPQCTVTLAFQGHYARMVDMAPPAAAGDESWTPTRVLGGTAA